MSMFDFVFVTPEEAHERNILEGVTLSELKKRASNNAKCCNCSNPVWRLIGGDMCFACTVGSTDASEDYELVDEK